MGAGVMKTSTVGSSMAFAVLGHCLLAILLCGSTSETNGELGGPRRSMLLVSLCTVSRAAGDSMLLMRCDQLLLLLLLLLL
jgi:hypothetical protein